MIYHLKYFLSLAGLFRNSPLVQTKLARVEAELKAKMAEAKAQRANGGHLLTDEEIWRTSNPNIPYQGMGKIHVLPAYLKPDPSSKTGGQILNEFTQAFLQNGGRVVSQEMLGPRPDGGHGPGIYGNFSGLKGHIQSTGSGVEEAPLGVMIRANLASGYASGKFGPHRLFCFPEMSDQQQQSIHQAHTGVRPEEGTLELVNEGQAHGLGVHDSALKSPQILNHIETYVSSAAELPGLLAAASQYAAQGLDVRVVYNPKILAEKLCVDPIGKIEMDDVIVRGEKDAPVCVVVSGTRAGDVKRLLSESASRLDHPLHGQLSVVEIPTGQQGVGTAMSYINSLSPGTKIVVVDSIAEYGLTSQFLAQLAEENEGRFHVKSICPPKVLDPLTQVSSGFYTRVTNVVTHFLREKKSKAASSPTVSPPAACGAKAKTVSVPKQPSETQGAKVTVPKDGNEGALSHKLPSGTTVKEGDEIGTIEVNKATISVKATKAGVLNWKTDDGANTNDGDVIAQIEGPPTAAVTASPPSVAVSRFKPGASKKLQEIQELVRILGLEHTSVAFAGVLPDTPDILRPKDQSYILCRVFSEVKNDWITVALPGLQKGKLDTTYIDRCRKIIDAAKSGTPDHRSLNGFARAQFVVEVK